MKFEWQRFPRQLKYWGMHCVINALPSLIIACWLLGLWEKPAAVVAMLLAIATFVLVYAGVTSLDGPISDKQSSVSRALKLGARVRLVVSLVSLVVMLCGGFLFLPDFWAGMYSVSAVNWIAAEMGHQSPVVGEGGVGHPMAVYFATMIEGGMISAMLLMVSFFALIVMQIRNRRKLARTWVGP